MTGLLSNGCTQINPTSLFDCFVAFSPCRYLLCLSVVRLNSFPARSLFSCQPRGSCSGGFVRGTSDCSGGSENALWTHTLVFVTYTLITKRLSGEWNRLLVAFLGLSTEWWSGGPTYAGCHTVSYFRWMSRVYFTTDQSCTFVLSVYVAIIYFFAKLDIFSTLFGPDICLVLYRCSDTIFPSPITILMPGLWVSVTRCDTSVYK